MAASPQTVTNNPLFLNARTNVYTAEELRKPWEDMPIGPGVRDLDSFRVRQRVAGANMSVDVVAASVLNTAWVRSSGTLASGPTASADAGLYRVDYNSASILNLDIAAADPTNPRIDQIFLAVEDAQITGSNNQATVRVVAGTATVGATLDNRTGVGATPAGMGVILLADVLVPAASASVVTANIRDRRPFGEQGTIPPLGSTGSQLDMVTFVPAPGLPVFPRPVIPTTYDNLQAAALMFLPRRIVGATKIRWKYGQGATAATSQYVLFIADASGRVIAQTAATAFAGAVSTLNEVSVALTATTTFDAGNYYVGIGLAALTAASGPGWWGADLAVAPGVNPTVGSTVRNTGFRSAAGGVTVPSTILAFTDDVTFTAATACPAVPVVSLSVT